MYDTFNLSLSKSKRLPSMISDPEFGLIKPTIISIKVLLPIPDFPVKQILSPLFIYYDRSQFDIPQGGVSAFDYDQKLNLIATANQNTHIN
jgi:hypothetical protein